MLKENMEQYSKYRTINKSNDNLIIITNKRYLTIQDAMSNYNEEYPAEDNYGTIVSFGNECTLSQKDKKDIYMLTD